MIKQLSCIPSSLDNKKDRVVLPEEKEKHEITIKSFFRKKKKNFMIISIDPFLKGKNQI
jgi:hypothetical protein